MINKEEFEQYILSGKTIPQLQEIYSISRTKVAQYKRDFGFVGITPNSRKTDRESGVKYCKTCNIEKPLTAFYSNGISAVGLRRYKPSCIICENSSRKNKLFEFILEYLESKGKTYHCDKCADTDERGFLDFHHINPEDKEFNIGDSNNQTMSYETFISKIKPELDKCILLCPSCHRREHLLMGRK